MLNVGFVLLAFVPTYCPSKYLDPVLDFPPKTVIDPVLLEVETAPHKNTNDNL